MSFRPKVVVSVLCVVSILGCATYAHRVKNARNLFDSGQYDSAIEQLKLLVEKKDKDYLLALLDLGSAYHAAGRYQEAIDTFLLADKEAEIKDYQSLGEDIATVVVNDELKPYKSEHFEYILISAYLAIDYTLLGKWEDALVECRRVNHKLDRMISEGKLPYEHNSFAKYLAASLFEARREYNDAFVDYRTLLKWADNLPYLGLPLIRVTDRLKSLPELEEYQKKFPEVKNYRLGKDKGEIIVLAETGRIPYKTPHPNFHLIPTFTRSYYVSDFVWIRTAKGQARSYPFFDIESTAIKELEGRSSAIIAKKIAGTVAKEAVGYGVQKATGSELLGALTAFALRVTDQADLRSWSVLPAKLHIARLTLPAGRHDISIDMVGQGGIERKGVKVISGYEVRPGQIGYINVRTPD